MAATEPAKIRQHRRRRTPRHGQDLARRGAALPGGKDEPARDDRAGHDRLRLGRGRAEARHVALRLALPSRVAGPEDQPHRHARRRRLPGRHDRRAAGRRGRRSSSSAASWASRSTRARVWNRAEEYELSRVVFVNMLDRERADFYRVARGRCGRSSPTAASRSSSRSAPSTSSRASSTSCTCARTWIRRAGRRAARSRSPTRWPTSSQEYREKLLDAVVETDEELMERYLDGRGARRRGGRARAQGAVTRDELYPGRLRRRDEEPRHDRAPRPARRGRPVAGARRATTIEFGDAKQAVFIFKTIADPFTGRISLFRVLAGPVHGDTTLVDPRTHAKERLGQVLLLQGKDSEPVRRARRSATSAPSRSSRTSSPATCSSTTRSRRAPAHRLPRAGHELRDHAEGEGRRGEDGDRRSAA